MKYLGVALLSSLIFLSSCVSMSDYKQLENDFTAYKESMQGRQEKLEEDMRIFKMGYDPRASEIFSNNVVLANSYYAEIKVLRDDIASMNTILKTIKREAEDAKNDVLNNARTSQSQNVVNEFYYLRRQWENTVNEMNKMVFVAQQSVTKAQTAASESYEKAIFAERAAKIVTDMAKNVNDIMNTMQSVSQRLAYLEQGAALDRKNYSDMKKAMEDILAKLKIITDRVTLLEKKVFPEKQGNSATPGQ